MKYILGVDVGGSKTHAAIATMEGEILSDARIQGAIYSSTGMAEVMNVLQKAIDICMKEAGIDIHAINIGVFGMTGVDWDFEKQLHQEALNEKFPEIDEIKVCNDSVIALLAGTKNNWGTILCSGTGFNAASISPGGESFIFGFYESGPHCGGKSLGRQIIKSVCSSHVGLCVKTELTDIVLKHLNVKNTDELLIKFLDGKFSKELLVALPAKLFYCYNNNDKVSITLVENMYKEQAKHAIVAIKNLNMENTCPDIVLSGGMLKAAPKDAVSKISSYISNEIIDFNLFYSIYEPVFGALKKGMIHLGASKEKISTLYMRADCNMNMLRKT